MLYGNSRKKITNRHIGQKKTTDDVGMRCRGFDANTLGRSCGDLRSRSASELLFHKRPSFLASRRFA
jgi:hypothetical protein